MNLPPRANKLVGGLVCAWMITAGSGFLLWGIYHATPGSPGAPRTTWPSAARVGLEANRPTLLIFLNPGCPCSAASVAELATLVERCPGQFKASAVVYRPVGGDGAGGGDRFEASLAAIPGLDRWDDLDGAEAGRLGVETSGHVLLYEPSGRLLFSGGITLGRGQEGENPGLDRLIEAAGGRAVGAQEAPVFGCSVLDRVATGRQEAIR